MVRKTKEQALATRGAILDAAECLFESHGVSRTSLQDIASAAGMTRGAIYWHFTDKADLFNAMMARVCLPMEETGARLERGASTAPLQGLREHVLDIFTRVANDRQVQRVFAVASHKVEYVDGLSAVRERHLQSQREHTALLERALRAAHRRGELPRLPHAALAAIGLHALINGLIQSWMLDREAFDLPAAGRRALELYLAGLAAGA